MTSPDVQGEGSPRVEAPPDVVLLANRAANLRREQAYSSGTRAAPVARRSLVWWVAYGVAWIVALGLATLAGLRIFYHDGNYLLTCINAFTLYVYLPAYIVLAWATGQRRWVLSLVCGSVVACHLIWVAPDALGAVKWRLQAASESADPAAETVRILFANVRGDGRGYDAFLRQVERVQPDVIAVAEFNGSWRRAFRESALSTQYAYGSNRNQGGAFPMVNIFSRLPIKNYVRKWAAGRNWESIEIETTAGDLRLVALHAPRPMPTGGAGYFEFWHEMVPVLTHQKGPWVLVGDFNATQHARVYGQLEAAGLRSAHEARGRGYAVTWPNGHMIVPPIRIDQAFLSPDVYCERIVEGEWDISDHRPLVIDVRLK